MKKQKTQSKLIVALTAVVLLLVALSATLTFAYFTANSSAVSDSMQFGTLSLDTANLTLGTNEDEASGVENHTDECAINNIVPGCTIQLGGNVNVEGSIDAFVRAQLSITVKQYRDSNGAAFTAVAGTGDNSSKNYVTGHANEAAYELQGTSGAYYLEFTTNQTHASNKNKADEIFDLIFAQINSTASNWISYTDGYMYYKQAVNGASTGDDLLVLDDKYITLDPIVFGNDWQGAQVSASLGVQAIQAEHLTGIASDAVLNDLTTDAEELLALSGLTTIWGNASGVIGA